ncbi:MAG: pitrilysin family protein [Patescibacteria group bacterium]
MKIQNYKLDNGLRVVEDPIEGSNSFTLMVMFRTGSRNETPNIWGISHFLEHMAFKGTKTYPSAYLLAKELDGLGAAYNAYTSKEHTGYFLKGSKRVFGKALAIISEMTTDPIILDQEVNKERGAIIEELNMYEDDPRRKVADFFEESLYEDHQVSQEIIGSKETLKQIHAKEIIDYRNKYYRTGNAVVSIAGNIPNDFRSQVEASFKKLNQGFEQYLPAKNETRKPVNLIYKKTQQTHLALGYPGVSVQDEDKNALRVLATLLGGNMSSRMFSEVREKRGLAYYVRTFADNMYDVGAIATFAGVNNEKIYDAVKIIKEIYGKAAENIPEDELQKTKDFMTGILTLSYEDSEFRSELNAMTELYGIEHETLEEKIEKTEKVTAKEISELAKKIFDEKKLCLALIGPSKDEAKFSETLNS